MKKTSTQNFSELIKTKDGSELEQAAAIAVVSSLLAAKTAEQQNTKSNWASGSGLRKALDRD